MADRRTHVIRLTAVGDPDTYIDLERIDSFTTTQSQPGHWQKTKFRLDWGDGSTREVYGPEDLLSTEVTATPDVIVEGPGPTGTNRDVTIIEVKNPQDESQIVKVGVVKKMSALEHGESPSYQKTFSLFDDTQPADGDDDNTTRAFTTIRVVKHDDPSNYLDQQVVGSFSAIEHGAPTYQKAITKLDNRYLLDAFDRSPADAKPIRLDPFQNAINVNWQSDYLIIAYAVRQSSGAAGTATVSDFNMPGWDGIAIGMTSAARFYPDGGSGVIGNEFAVSARPSGAQGWKSSFNLNLIGTVEDFGSSYIAIALGAAKPNPTLDFSVHFACDAPPGVNGGSYQPLEILYTSAVADWGPLPSDGGDPTLWPLYFYGPVTDIGTGDEVIFYSNTPGVGGLYGGPPLDNPATILKTEAEGLWGLPVGNTRWPPLVSLTPIPDPTPGPTFGELIYQFLPSVDGVGPGTLLCYVMIKTVRGLKKVVNPPVGWGVGAYAPVLLPAATPEIVRASSMDIIDDPPSSDAPHCVIADKFDLDQTNFGIFPYWVDASVPGFPTTNFGAQNCILTEYLNTDPDAPNPDTFSGGAVGGVPEDRGSGTPAQPAIVLDATARFSVDLKTFAITRIA